MLFWWLSLMLSTGLTHCFTHCLSITLQHEINYSLNKKKEGLALSSAPFSLVGGEKGVDHLNVATHTKKNSSSTQAVARQRDGHFNSVRALSLSGFCIRGHVIPCCRCWWIEKRSAVWLLSAQKPQKAADAEISQYKDAGTDTHTQKDIGTDTLAHKDEACPPSVPYRPSPLLLLYHWYYSPSYSSPFIADLITSTLH